MRTSYLRLLEVSSGYKIARFNNNSYEYIDSVIYENLSIAEKALKRKAFRNNCNYLIFSQVC